MSGARGHEGTQAQGEGVAAATLEAWKAIEHRADVSLAMAESTRARLELNENNEGKKESTEL